MPRREIDDDNRVIPLVLRPAMEGEHAILVMRVDDAEALPALPGATLAQGQQFAHEAQMVVHLHIALI